MTRMIGGLVGTLLFIASAVAGQTRPTEVAQTYISPSSPASGWVARSESDVSDDGDQSAPDIIFRLRGDAASHFYYLEWSNDSAVSDEAGHLLAQWPGTPDFAARRSDDHLILYVVADQAGRLSRYDIVAIEHGRARRWRCAVGPDLLNAMNRGSASDDRILALQQTLVAHEPALDRDHCSPISDGIGRKVAIRPALRLAFPQIGATFREDERGLRGGWLYQGSMSCNQQGWRRCWVSQYLGDGRTAFIVQVAGGSGRKRRVRVTNIFYADSLRVREQDCRVGRDYPVAGISDPDGKGGEIFFTNGARLWSLHWRDALPAQCRPING